MRPATASYSMMEGKLLRHLDNAGRRNPSPIPRQMDFQGLCLDNSSDQKVHAFPFALSNRSLSTFCFFYLPLPGV